MNKIITLFKLRCVIKSSPKTQQQSLSNYIDVTMNKEVNLQPNYYIDNYKIFIKVSLLWLFNFI